MAGLNIQTNDVTSRLLCDNALVPVPCQSLSGGSSNPPKYGTLIPNRIFVGGIPSNTTEQELKGFFSSFGQVKDVKIINDRLGASKGSYGFVTFENQEMAEKIIKNESETLIFKDRKLNIGHAIRKQQVMPRPVADIPTTLFFTGGPLAPYGIQNGMAVYPMSGQEYPLMTQSAAASYATMMLPQQNGNTALYLPAAATMTASTGVQNGSAYGLTSHQQQQNNANGTSTLAAALQQQAHVQAQHHQLAPTVSSLTNGAGAGSSNAAAVMAAAAAAMAACAQWPNGAATGLTQTANLNAQASATHQQQQLAAASLLPNLSTSHHTSQSHQQQQHQQAMSAALLAQQQAAWRWSPCPQNQQQPGSQQGQQTAHVTSSSQQQQQLMSTPVTAATSVLGGTPPAMGAMSSATAAANGGAQQSPAAAPMGPATFLYSPLAGAGHEVMFFHQNSSPYAANSTSDYSTDHSAHSSMLESVEQHLSFPCDATPPGRASHHLQAPGLYSSHPHQNLTANGDGTTMATGMSAYGTIPPLMADPQSHAHLRQAAAVHAASIHVNQYHAHTQGQLQATAAGTQLISIAAPSNLAPGGTQPLLAHPATQQHQNAKMYVQTQQQQQQQQYQQHNPVGLTTIAAPPGGMFGIATSKQDLCITGEMKLDPSSQQCSGPSIQNSGNPNLKQSPVESTA